MTASQTDKTDDGGPAYPAINGMPHDEHGIMRPTYLSTGMTLRDYFAAKAMQALIADTNNHDDWMQDQEYCAFRLRLRRRDAEGEEDPGQVRCRAMSDATTQQDWKAGLTEAQVSTVEKAARAAYDICRYSAEWDEMSDVYRAYRCSEMLAALRAAKHPDFPEPPRPTRGEVVAEKLVDLRPSDGVLWFHHMTEGWGQVIERSEHDHASLLPYIREAIAAAIDAERAAAFEEAARIVEGLVGNTHHLVKDIRELAKGAQPK